jgi:serine/threonine-protein kinase RCK2
LFPTITIIVLIRSIDLIRHGRHHHHVRHDNNIPPDAQYSHSDDSTSGASARQQEQSDPDKSVPVPPSDPPPTREEAAKMIVNEEREAKDKIPIYKGLEAFKLVEKMGESVYSSLRLLIFSSLMLAIQWCVL